LCSHYSDTISWFGRSERNCSNELTARFPSVRKCWPISAWSSEGNARSTEQQHGGRGRHDNETDKANAKGNHLDHFTSALLNLLSDKGITVNHERLRRTPKDGLATHWPYHDQTKTQIRSVGKPLAHKQNLVKVLGISISAMTGTRRTFPPRT
jgi:hypothetical protein